MTEQSTLGRHARYRRIRHEVDEARAYGLQQRHIRKLQHLKEAARPGCLCESPSVHRHTCSYDDVIGLLSASVPGTLP